MDSGTKPLAMITPALTLEAFNTCGGCALTN